MRAVNGDPIKGEAKRQQMLQSGQWTANPDGSLSRVKKEAGIPLGLPSKERISELEHMNRPLTENERREYALHAFDPSANANILFSLIAGASPAGAATDVLGGVASKIASGGVKAVTRLLKTETGRNLLDKVVDVLPERATDQALYPLARRNAGRESSTKEIWNEVADSAQKKRQGLNKPTKPVSAADPEGFLDTRGRVDPRAQKISVRHQDGAFESSGEWNPAVDPTRESGSFIASKDMQRTSKPMAVYRAPRQASSSTEGAANWEKYRVVRDGKESDVVINDLKQGDQVQSLSQGRVATDGSELYMPDSKTKRGGRYVSTTKDPETLSFFNSGSKGESQYSADIGEITSNDNTSYFKVELPSGSPVLRPNSYRDKGDVGNYGMDFTSENEITLSPHERYKVKKIENQPLTNFFSKTRKADLSKAELDELGKKTRKVVTVEPISRDFSTGGILPNGDPTKEKLITSAQVDSIVQAPHSGILPFKNFRDHVLEVEGGNNRYRALQGDMTKDTSDDGPGRGGFQFDYDTAVTAYTRLQGIAKRRGMKVPELTDHQLANMDTVDPEIQDMLFTAHFAVDPKSSVEQILSDSTSWAPNWADAHWKGDPKKREGKMDMFNQRLYK